jgi:branched-chain amino acid aminotransferase
MGTLVSMNGRIVPPEQAVVSVFDHGFLFGDSVYEVVRTRRGVPVTLREHLARLRASAERLYMELPWTDDGIGGRIAEVLRAAGNRESYLRIVATRGVGEISLLPDTCRDPLLLVIAKPLPEPPASVMREGIAVAVVGRPRIDRRALDPGAKTGNYLNNALALIEARRAGAEDAILLNPEGHLAEGTTSNVFFVRGGRVHTPELESGILAGITRSLLLREMPAAGLPVVEGRYPEESLREAEEVFLTSTVRGVAPVTRVDGRAVGDGRPGPVARKVAALYEAALDRLADAAGAPPA